MKTVLRRLLSFGTCGSVLALLGLILLVIGCGDEAGEQGGECEPACSSGYACVDGACAKKSSEEAGALGEPCYPNDTCDSGLDCEAGTCVSCAEGSLGCSCFANQTCLDELNCEENLCVEEDDVQPEPPLLGGDAWDESVCGASPSWTDVEYSIGCGPFGGNFIDAYQSSVGNLQWNSGVGGNLSGKRPCSGGMISDDLFLTAAHCFEIEGMAELGWDFPTTIQTPDEFCASMHVDFQYQLNADTGQPYKFGGHDGESYDCVVVEEVRLGGHDYAIVTLSGSPGKKYGHFSLKAEVKSSDDILIIQHPAGMPKKVECGTVSSVSNGKVYYGDVDTEGGSSGASILDASGFVVGVHTTGGCSPDGGNNSGATVAAIASFSPIVKAILSSGTNATVVDVKPDVATKGVETEFTIVGTGLPKTIDAYVDGCTNKKITAHEAEMAKFMCTFSQVGVKEGWVYNEPNGEVIFSFEVEVAEDAPECDELCSGKECGAYEECNCGPCDWGYSCEGHLCKLDCIQMCSDKECGMHEGCDCGACSKTVVLQAGMSAQVLYWVEVENGVSTSPHDTANFYGSSPIWIGSEYDEDDDGDYVAHKHRAYLWFPLEDELPSDASIVSATLKLDVAQRFGQTGYQVFVKHALEPWEDDVITWDNQPGASNTGLVSVAAPKDTGIYSIPVTDYVQDIVDGVIPYYGEFVRASSEDDAEDGIEANFNFYASGDTGDLPELHIEYQ